MRASLSRSGAPVLTLLKGVDTVEADLFERDGGGVEYRLFVNGRFLIGRLFTTRAEAVAHLSTMQNVHRRDGSATPKSSERHIA